MSEWQGCLTNFHHMLLDGLCTTYCVGEFCVRSFPLKNARMLHSSFLRCPAHTRSPTRSRLRASATRRADCADTHNGGLQVRENVHTSLNRVCSSTDSRRMSSASHLLHRDRNLLKANVCSAVASSFHFDYHRLPSPRVWREQKPPCHVTVTPLLFVSFLWASAHSALTFVETCADVHSPPSLLKWWINFRPP